MSVDNMQLPQAVPHQPHTAFQYPSVATISGTNYENVNQHAHPVLRSFYASGSGSGSGGGGGSGSDNYGAYPVSSLSGYGNSGPEENTYDVPSGTGYSHYSTGPAYGHPHPAHHRPFLTYPPHAPHPPKTTFSFNKKRKSSAVTALTLLSFFFFINLLQNCLQEHEPPVMVMVDRTRVPKTEMNSREHAATGGAETASDLPVPGISSPNIVLQPADLLNAAAVHTPTIASAFINVDRVNNQSSPNKPPFAAFSLSNNGHDNPNPSKPPDGKYHINRRPSHNNPLDPPDSHVELEFHDSPHSYRNQSLVVPERPHHQQQQHDYDNPELYSRPRPHRPSHWQSPHYLDRERERYWSPGRGTRPWSHGGAPSASSSSSGTHGMRLDFRPGELASDSVHEDYYNRGERWPADGVEAGNAFYARIN